MKHLVLTLIVLWFSSSVGLPTIASNFKYKNDVRLKMVMNNTSLLVRPRTQPFIGMILLPYIICYFAENGVWPAYPASMKPTVAEMGQLILSQNDDKIRIFCQGKMSQLNNIKSVIFHGIFHTKTPEVITESTKRTVPTTPVTTVTTLPQVLTTQPPDDMNTDVNTSMPPTTTLAVDVPEIITTQEVEITTLAENEIPEEPTEPTTLANMDNDDETAQIIIIQPVDSDERKSTKPTIADAEISDESSDIVGINDKLDVKLQVFSRV